jgi:transposase
MATGRTTRSIIVPCSMSETLNRSPARRNTTHGSGLGKTRWVVERTLSWLHKLRRLLFLAQRRADIHDTFMALGCTS